MKKQFFFSNGHNLNYGRPMLGLISTLIMFFLLSFSMRAADVRVYTFDSQGNPIAGTFKIQKGPNFVGTFNSGDTANLTAGDNYLIWAIFGNTSTERVTLNVGPTGDSLAFRTTNVKFHFSGDYLDYHSTNSWTSFGPKVGGEWPARELFPYDFYGDTIKIRPGYFWSEKRYVSFDIFYGGQTSVEKTISVIRVLDSDGSPISGATARGGYATPTVWHVPGSTNADGLLVDLRNGEQNNLSYEAKVNGTIAVEGPKDPTLDSYYLFQTEMVVLKLQSCNEIGIAGGNPRFGSGTNFNTRWFPDNPGISTDSAGEAIGQLFPGTYSFDMQYKATSDQKISVTIPVGGDTIIWNTVSVNLTSSGSISYGGANGTSTWFTQPSMELLPGTYKFKFNSSGTIHDFTLSGCNFSKSEVLVDVLDCNGNNQAGVDVKWYKYGSAGNIQAAGTTGSSTFPVLIGSGATDVVIVVNYLGESNSLRQNITTSNTFTFQMIDVALVLMNHDSTSTLTPQNVQFYVYGQAGNKMPFPSSLNKCLLSGKYGFVVKYNETSQNKNNIDVSIHNPVIFRTGLIDDLDECTYSPTSYYQYGSASNTFPFLDPMEFMPSKVVVKSSANPNKTVDVVSGTIHRLDNCAMGNNTQVLMDSCVSDSGWMKSTIITNSNHNGFWGGVSSLPDMSTFTDTAEVGFPKPWGGMGLAPGSLPIKSNNHIAYFTKNFGLTDTVDIDARFRMFMDDAVEIYINGVLIAREENMDWNNFNGVPHDLLINADDTHSNGYLGGDAFDFVSTLDLDTVLNKGMNKIVIVLRNPANPKNNGGFSFRMDITKNGESVLVKKRSESSKDGNDPGVLAVYPNPVDNMLSINLEDINIGLASEINVFNLNGQLMLHKDIYTPQDVVELDLSNLTTGFYFVRYNSGDDVRHAKIIKR
ncbi:T9SS type A sorting domain-containing protein [Owenweeksia hongkongensis]|uniref:T9SS type A sorting domain-containing protein n=1 Tax=Owenweeksia hongkongensis TaxID=253245 RepID=UPI003A946281